MGFQLNRISKTFRSRSGDTLAVEDVSFTVGAREFVSLVGPSGCGKSTLLRLIAGLIEPASGSIEFASEPNNGQLKTAMVFQEKGLFPWLNVLDNITFGQIVTGEPTAERHERARAYASRIGLAGFEERFPHELSGGMRKRVALARAFVTAPQNILMDEPFASLDAQTRIILQRELLQLWEEQQTTVFFVTHDIDEALLLSDRVLVMTRRPGRIAEEIMVPKPRSRDLDTLHDAELVAIKQRIWHMLENEVRQSLQPNTSIEG